MIPQDLESEKRRRSRSPNQSYGIEKMFHANGPLACVRAEAVAAWLVSELAREHVSIDAMPHRTRGLTRA